MAAGSQIIRVRQAQAQDPDTRETKELLNKFGLAVNPSAFEKPAFAFDCQQQIPPVVCHQFFIGLCGRALLLTLTDFTPQGRETLQTVVDGIVRPPDWEAPIALRLSSTSGKLMMGAEDIKHVMQIIVFALSGDILELSPVTNRAQQKKREVEASSHKAFKPLRLKFTAEAEAKYRARAKEESSNLIFQAFLAMAEALPLLCARTRQSGSASTDKLSLDLLQQKILDCMRILQSNWPTDFLLPNVTTALHYRPAVGLFGVAAVLNLCVEEMFHSVFKHQAHTTSGRATVVELMELENFRQASRVLRLSAESSRAATVPEIARLPFSIRAALLNPADASLRNLLQPRATANHYGKSTVASQEDALLLRVGPITESLVLDEREKQLVASALVPEVTSQQIPSCVKCVRFLVPAGNRRKDTIWVDPERKGLCHYWRRGPGGNCIVRVTHAFELQDRGFVKVLYGHQTRLDNSTACQAWEFNTDRVATNRSSSSRRVRHVYVIVFFVACQTRQLESGRRH
jgi:hypothetical protein